MSIQNDKNQDLLDKVRVIPDFPQQGIQFYDITTLLADAEGLRVCVDRLAALYEHDKPDVVVGIDARGFILASALAYKLDCGLALIRKKGKLPFDTYEQAYLLEYGEAILEVHTDAFEQHKTALLADDLLATGGTAQAAVQLIEKAGGEVQGLACMIELLGLKGREKLSGYRIEALMSVD